MVILKVSAVSKEHVSRYDNHPRNRYEIAKIRKISKLQLQKYFRIRFATDSILIRILMKRFD